MSQKSNVWSLIFVATICLAIVIGIAANNFISQLQDKELGFLLGVATTLVIVIATAGVLSGFVLAYSILRRKEESEDDRRELEMLRAVTQMRGNQTIKLETPQQAADLPWRVRQDRLPANVYDEMERVVLE